MVITDHFTKYAQAYITPKQIAIVVACPLWENFLVHYGWPEKILTDQGKSFENNLFQELCKLAQVKKLCTSPYHPETNGQCEHFNATLISMLGTLPSYAKKNWQEWVLHRNMLFPLKTSEKSSPKKSENVQNIALMKANLLMDIYFDN